MLMCLQDKVFRVTIANTDPIVFYSSQGDECPKGMVGIVNPNDKETLDDYKKRAGALARGVTPGQSTYGGELAGNTAPSPTGSKNNDKDNKDGKDGKSAAGTLLIPLLTLVTSLGAIIFTA